MTTSVPDSRLKSLLHRFLTDERGMIVSAELMIIMTVGVLALVTGLSSATSALNLEYIDIANAIGGLNQTYNIRGHVAPGHAFNCPSGFNDVGQTFVGHSVSACIDEATVSGLAFEVVEEPVLSLEEVVECPEVECQETQALLSEAQFRQYLALLEQEAKRLEHSQAEANRQAAEPCSLDELQELEDRIRKLRTQLEQRNVQD